MDWKDLASILGKSAPLLGTLIGGPAGAAVGGLVASALGVEKSPDAVSQALTVNPDAAVKLAEIEKTRAVDLQGLVVKAEENRLAADTASVLSVNASIQAEAKADHWPTYTWRPFIGFCFGLYVLSLFLLPLFKLTPVSLSADITLVIGGILGIASYYRGKAQANPAIPTDNRG